MQPETAKVVEDYNPLRAKPAQCTQAEWDQIRPFVQAAVAPLDKTPVGIRPYLTAATAVGVWALRQGFELDTWEKITPQVIEHLASNRPSNRATFRSTLRALAKAHGVQNLGHGAKVAKRSLKAPYTAEDEAALWRFARNIGNERRQVSLRALLLLGFGCGMARNDLRGVTAADIHTHLGSSATTGNSGGDGTVHIRVGERCVPVRDEYRAEMEWVRTQRPDGWLIGNHGGQNLTTRHVEWVGQRQGVPALSPDRLRATWICHHLTSGVSLTKLLWWSGLQGCESLDAYLEFIDLPSGDCPCGAGLDGSDGSVEPDKATTGQGRGE